MPNSLPLVSVIIPAYNAASTLRGCVQSVLRDAYENLELLIINDGSTDETSIVADNLSIEFPGKVRVFSQANAGANKARNVGLRQAKGAYVQFLDADDELQHNKIHSSVCEFRKKEKVVCVYSSGEVVTSDGRKKIIQANFNHIRALIERSSNLFTCGMQTAMPIWSRSFLVENGIYWDEALPCWQEAEYHTRCLTAVKAVEDVCEIHVPGLLFRRNQLSQTGISSGYWSDKYIIGQYNAITRMVNTCTRAGMSSVIQQQKLYMRLLTVRAIVGNQVRAYSVLTKATREDSPSILDFCRSLIPFRIARAGYIGFRSLKYVIRRLI